MFKRLTLFTLTLVLTLGLLVVPALAACNHVCSEESGCITRQLTCGLEEHKHSMTNDWKAICQGCFLPKPHMRQRSE